MVRLFLALTMPAAICNTTQARDRDDIGHAHPCSPLFQSFTLGVACDLWRARGSPASGRVMIQA